jgi:16S rRNA (uracil1498-N3)-methyltransferase
MRVRRFQVDDLSGPTARLVGQEAVHALRVLRLKVGDAVVLFDGLGNEAQAVIRATARDSLDVEILERSASSPRNAPQLILAVAVPKGERADWLVERCAELGISTIQPLHLERSTVIPSDAKIARWRRKAVQAAKQAGHAATMTIEPLKRLQEALTAIPLGTHIWIAEPGKATPLLSTVLAAISPAKRVGSSDLVFVGPEGGFAAAERTAILAAGAKSVRLCTPILRVETAAVAAAVIWAAWAAQTPPSPEVPF